MLTITVLVENSDGKDLCGEHGLSLFIEYNGGKYLLDMGAMQFLQRTLPGWVFRWRMWKRPFRLMPTMTMQADSRGSSRRILLRRSTCRKRLQKTATRRGREHGSTSACRGESCGSTPIGSALCREHRRIRNAARDDSSAGNRASPPASGSRHTPLRIWKSRAERRTCTSRNTAAISQMTSPTSRA